MDMEDIAIVGGPVEVPTFTVDSLDKANWAMAKIARAEERAERRKLAAEAYKSRVDAWLTDANKADLDTVDHLTEMLRPWAETEIAKAGKTKHVKLLGGEIGYRQSPERLDWVGNDADLAALPDTLKRVKVEPDKVAAKAQIKATGEIPAGFNVVPGEVRWYVKADPGALVGDVPEELPA
jgi:phage host-nuclease inhibitor protein Gam